MKPNMIILGIETSCDETSAAIIEAKNKQTKVRILSNISPSSMILHAKTGGIIPETAAREQIRYIIPVINKALKEAKITNPKTEIDAVAVTVGPGLIGSLLVGVETAKTLAWTWNKPLISVNHLFGHMYANWIELNNNISPEKKKKTKETKVPPFPILALIISGGHTDLVLIKEHQNIQWLGGTRDDAAGEALDKIGRLLKLPYPGGPAIERNALNGNPKAFQFPRPLKHDGSSDFSFSGLKTAVLREVQRQYIKQEQQKNFLENKDHRLSAATIADICRCTQDAVIDVLLYKTLKAAIKYNVSSIIISGGVSANQTIREEFQKNIASTLNNVAFFAPPKQLSTDNAAMIATAAYFNPNKQTINEITANPELYFD